MILAAADVDEIRQLVSQNRIEQLQALKIQGTTLAAALELACCRWMWRETDQAAAAIIDEWATRMSWLHSAWTALNQRGMPAVPFHSLYSAPDWEICPSPLANQVTENDWNLFLERFVRSLQNHGFARRLALSLSKAFGEMSDNVIRHSGANGSDAANAVLAYHVEDKRMTFAVADVGRGILASLNSDSRWTHLQTSTEALQAAVWNAATSTPDEEFGDGFLQVRRSLTDLNGILRFRSGDGVLSMVGHTDERQGSIGFVPPLIGFQLSVSCAL